MVAEGDVHEGEHLSADSERERNDEEHEERHLCYKEQEDLLEHMLAFVSAAEEGRNVDRIRRHVGVIERVSTYETVIERHLCGLFDVSCSRKWW